WVNERLSSNRAANVFNVVQIQNIISPDRILFLNYAKKRDALVAMAENLAGAPQIKSRQELVAEILRREDLMSTAIGRGIAIPHVRLSSVTDLVVAVGVSQCDIMDFQSLDDVPVRLLFMIAAAYNQHAYYLQTLSFFSSRLKNNELRTSLASAKTPQDVYALLASQDEQ
ncbi:MAG TPA: PTS sugar transporter subunit IIA, partial [Rectinemataceae bacterium]|nr:PTS sugar transporter subunit IIA [Rectinemataceae bacterium]